MFLIHYVNPRTTTGVLLILLYYVTGQWSSVSALACYNIFYFNCLLYLLDSPFPEGIGDLDYLQQSAGNELSRVQ